MNKEKPFNSTKIQTPNTPHPSWMTVVHSADAWAAIGRRAMEASAADIENGFFGSAEQHRISASDAFENEFRLRSLVFSPEQSQKPNRVQLIKKRHKQVKPSVQHSGDCSIWIGPICDCGELRRAASTARIDQEQILDEWCKHLKAIDRARDPIPPNAKADSSAVAD